MSSGYVLLKRVHWSSLFKKILFYFLNWVYLISFFLSQTQFFFSWNYTFSARKYKKNVFYGVKFQDNKLIWFCCCFSPSGLPVCPELVREHIPKTKDVGHFLSVTGTVIRTSLVKILEFERDYMCNKCKHVFVVKADFEQYYTFCRPSSCPSLEGCDSSKFTCLSGLSSSPVRCRDYQEIKIQEQVNDQMKKQNQLWRSWRSTFLALGKLPG